MTSAHHRRIAAALIGPRLDRKWQRRAERERKRRDQEERAMFALTRVGESEQGFWSRFSDPQFIGWNNFQGHVVKCGRQVGKSTTVAQKSFSIMEEWKRTLISRLLKEQQNAEFEHDFKKWKEEAEGECNGK